MVESEILKRAVTGTTDDDIARDLARIDAAIDRVRQDADREIAALEKQKALVVYVGQARETNQAMPVIARSGGAPPDEPRSNGAPSRPAAKGEKQAAVLDLLSDDRLYSKQAIGRHLIERGLMANEKKDWHSLDVLLSRMVAKTKKIARPQPSTFQSLAGASAIADERSRLPVEEVEV